MSKLHPERMEDTHAVREFTFHRLLPYVNPLLEYRTGSYTGTGVAFDLDTDLYVAFALFANTGNKRLPVIWFPGLGVESVDFNGNYFTDALLGIDAVEKNKFKIGTNVIVNELGAAINYLLVGE